MGDCLVQVARQGNRKREAALEIAALTELHPNSAWLRYYRGRLLWWPDETARAELLAAAGGFAEQGDASGEIRARTSLVTFLGFDREFEAAFEELAKAERLLGQDPIPENRALVLIAEAHYLMLKGEDLEKALRRLKAAHAAFSASGSGAIQDRLECLRSLITVALDLGLRSESHQYAQEAKRLARQAGALRDQVSTGYNAIYGTLRTELPDAESQARVLAELRAVFDLAQRVGYSEIEAQTRRLLAEMEGGPEADGHLARCRELARSIQDSDLERRCILALASRRIEDDPREARRLLSAAYAQGLSEPGPWSLFYGWEDHLSVLWATEPRERALAGGDAVLGAIEALRSAQVGNASTRLLAAWADAYYWQSGRLLEDSREPDAVRKAFAVAERLRAQTLREVLEQGRSGWYEVAAELSELPQDLLQSRQATELDLVKIYRTLLDPGLDSDGRQRALDRLADLESREAELQSRLAALAPSSTSFKPPRENLLERVTERLAHDEALLSYQLGLWQGWDREFMGGSWLLVTTRAGTRVVRLEADRASIEPWTKSFLGLPEPEGRPAVRLYREIVAEALEELDPRVRKLILVPDSLLHLLPFAALRPEVAAPPLIDGFELTFVPSADLWLHWREQQGDTRTAGKQALGSLVLANPTLPNATESAADRSWAFQSAANLGRLPFAEREGRSVTRRFGGAARLVANEEASEAFLKRENLEPYGVVHFAAHAVTDSERPNRSAILLAAGDASEDGFLRPGEIARLRGLDGKLVVLSSCNSASGDVLRGEGVLSLARAFFEAGAHAVVGSLWRLDDRQAATFFDDFYGHLARGESVAEAVASTQRRWAAKGRPASAWAGIVVLGNGDLVPLPGGASRRFTAAWAAGLAALALLVALWFRRSRARRPGS